MLSKIFQLIQVWLRFLWRQSTHSNEDESNSNPPPPIQEPEREPSKVCLGGLNRQIHTDIETDAPSNNRDQGSSANTYTDLGKDSTNSKQCKDAEPKTPHNTGGKREGRHTPTQQPPKDSVEAKRQFKPRLELICRQNHHSLQWELVLSADGECNISEVRHDGGELLGKRNGEYPIKSFARTLSITLENDEHLEFMLFDRTPMVFKLRNNWNGDGRMVRAITSGFYIVIVPKKWNRTGLVPFEPEGCTDPGFSAHSFSRKRSNSTGDVGGFEECEVALTKSGLMLTGDSVFDDSEDGELFVGAVPKLNLMLGGVWARVGKEATYGSGENFKPSERCLADVLQGQQGWFFVRVYDNDAKLLDSCEFRYLRDLREIRVNGERYSANTLLVPPSTGYSSMNLQFVGADETLMHPILATDGTNATVQPEGVLIVEPHPKNDAVSCNLVSGTSLVNTVIKLPRIWWQMKRDGGKSDEWHDTPLAMTRQEYREYANEGAAIQLRLPPRITTVRVGFDEELDRVYSPPKGGDDTELGLADFVDYSQIDQRPYKDASLNIQCDAAVLTLIRIIADPVPTIISFTAEPVEIVAGERAKLRWAIRNAESNGIVIDPRIGSVDSSGSMEVFPTETMTFTLKLTASGMDEVMKDLTLIVRSRTQPGEKLFACVKRTNGGYRRGKGFSRDEIHTAGLTIADASRLSITFDRRRKSAHRGNTKTIGRFIDA